MQGQAEAEGAEEQQLATGSARARPAKQCHRDKRLGLVATVTHPLYPQQRPQGIALRSVPQRAPGLPRASPLDPPLAIDHSKNVN